MAKRKGNPNWSNGTYNLLPSAPPVLCAWEKMLAAEGLVSDAAAIEELAKGNGARAAKIKKWVVANQNRFVPLAVLDALGMTEEVDAAGW